MNRLVKRAVPVASVVLRRVPARVSRSFWNWSVAPDLRSMVREVDRQVARFENDFYHRNRIPRVIWSHPVPVNPDVFQYTADLRDFKPEEITITSKGNVVTILARMEHSAEDGSRIQQQVTREFMLPEGVDAASLKSLFNADGTLTIEAPRKAGDPPKEIPINHETAQN